MPLLLILELYDINIKMLWCSYCQHLSCTISASGKVLQFFAHCRYCQLLGCKILTLC